MQKKQVMVKVKLDREGVRACGKYVANKVYEVTKDEAKRLVEVKGFKIIKDQGES